MLRRLSLSQILWGHSLFTLMLLLWLVVLFASGFGHHLAAWSAGLFYISYDTLLLLFIAYQTRRLGNPAEAAVAPANPEAIAILIPARNEAAVLPASLNALLPQLVAGDQLLVIDDGSTDNSLAVLRDFGIEIEASATPAEPRLYRSSRYPQLSLLHKANSGKADSMNLGLRLVDTPIVITLDADTYLESGALEAMRRAFGRNAQLVAAGGIIIPQCRPALMRWFFEWFQRFEYLRGFLAREAWAQAHCLLLVSGAFASYRREALLQVGGFDAASLVEDYEVNHRLHRYAYEHGLDWDIGVIGEAVAHTDAPASFRAFFAQRSRWFAGFLETQFRNSDMIGNRRYGPLGRLMLPIKSVDMLQPVFGATAIALLFYYAVSLHNILPWVLGVISIKLGIDFVYNFWAVHRYCRWVGRPLTASLLFSSALATLIEPFSFQFVRHIGAILGWIGLLRGRIEWTPQRHIGRRQPDHSG